MPGASCVASVVAIGRLDAVTPAGVHAKLGQSPP